MEINVKQNNCASGWILSTSEYKTNKNITTVANWMYAKKKESLVDTELREGEGGACKIVLKLSLSIDRIRVH